MTQAEKKKQEEAAKAQTKVNAQAETDTKAKAAEKDAAKPSVDMDTPVKYKVMDSGWPDGKLRKAGDTITMTPREAAFLEGNGQIVPEGEYGAAKKKREEQRAQQANANDEGEG
ncbi:MAG: hypothetical protein AAF903_12010 [Pseudomonadota bacterium]